MRIPSTLKPAALAALLAMASGAAFGATDRWWSWAPGCAAANMGTTAACWSDTPASSGSAVLTPASRPAADAWVSIIQTASTTLPIAFSSGVMQIAQLILAGTDAPAQISMLGGDLTLAGDRAPTSFDGTLFLGSEGVQHPGSARFVQTGGNVSLYNIVIGTSSDVASTYDISGGRVTADFVLVGSVLVTAISKEASKGILRVTGQGFADIGVLEVSALGKLDISGGELRAADLTLQTPDVMTFTGGRIKITGTKSVWSGGTFAYGSSLGLGTPTLQLATGSKLDVQDHLFIGQVGLGILQIDAGASLSTKDAVLGKGFSAFSGDGRASVSGAGAMWTIDGTLDIGELGRGQLQVLEGGKVTSQRSFLGRTEFPDPKYGRNSALVSGAGSLWRISETLTIGGGATSPGQGSDVTVTEGGRLEAGGLLQVWGGSTLQLGSGGTVEAGSLGVAPGGLVTLRGGTLRTTTGAQVDGKLSALPGGAGSIDGATVLGNTGHLEIDGGQIGFQSLLTAKPGSLVTLRDGTLNVASGLQLQGTLRTVSGTSNIVDGSVVLADGGRLEVAPSLVSFRGALTAGAGATIDNEGELTIEGRAVVQAGAFLVGNGATYVFGSLALGDGIATVSQAGALALMPGSVLEVDLGGGGAHDRFDTASWLLLGGTLKLSAVGGYRGQLGDRFSVLGGRLEGAFEGVDTRAFTLARGLAWDFSQLNSAGLVGIQAAPVPEPGTWASMLAGLLGLGLWRRRVDSAAAQAGQPTA